MLFPDDLFRANKNIFRIKLSNEWYYSIEDIIESISLQQQSRKEIPQTINLKQTIVSGKNIEITDLEGVFRIIQSINHPNAEPFKLWLAKVGKNQIENLQRISKEQI